MSEEMKKALVALQMAVDRELERKAKLGFKAVVADKHGKQKFLTVKISPLFYYYIIIT